jgi:hypothetical protein
MITQSYISFATKTIEILRGNKLTGENPENIASILNEPEFASLFRFGASTLCPIPHTSRGK